MRLVRDPTIRIFKTLNTAAVTTMVFQPATAPGDAPENPRSEPQHRDSAPSGPNAVCGEQNLRDLKSLSSPQKIHPVNMTE